MKYRFLGCGVPLLALANVASAEIQCNPRDFLLSEVTKVQHSAYMAIAAFDSDEQFKKETDETSFDASATVEGAPVKLSYGEAKSFFDWTKRIHKVNITDEQRDDYINIAVSRVGGEAYKNCLTAKPPTISIRVNDSGIFDNSFFAEITWSPDYTFKNPPAIGLAEVVGGFIVANGVKSAAAKYPIYPAGQEMVTLERNPYDPLQLGFSVDGKVDFIRIPPKEDFAVTPYFVDIPVKVEINSDQGDWNEKNVKFCAGPNNADDFLVESMSGVIKVVQHGDSTHSYFGPLQENSGSFGQAEAGNQFCVWLHSDAAGAASQRWGIDVTIHAFYLAAKQP